MNCIYTKLGAAFLACSHLAETARAENMVLANVFIYTVDKNHSTASAMAISGDGLILAVGTQQEAEAAAGGGARVVDLGGKMVLPGFQDAHLHALEAGVNEAMCEFEPFGGLEDYQESVRDCANGGGAGEWIVGSGVNMAHLLELDENPVEILDGVSPERPVLILDDIGHGAWANSAALKAAGYDALKGDPPGGIVLRDDATRKPNGVVLENAQQKLRNLAFPTTQGNVQLAYEGLLRAMKTLAENGITSVSDAGGFWPQGHQQAWEMAERNKTLTVRASNALYVYPDLDFDAQMAELKSRFSNRPDSLLRFNQAKIYVDGILEQGTGALTGTYQPSTTLYEGDGRGFLYFESSTLDRYSRELSKAGFQLQFHVTGDRSARLALDAIEQADAAPGPHRLTHLYLVDETDYPRFKKLGAAADFQLAPSSLDPGYLNDMSAIIGPLADRMLPARSLLDAGALVTLSSDWDADELSPLVKIETAVTRKENAIPSVATAIELMTINTARLLRQENMTGSIEAGKFADLAVLDKNILELPADQISSAKVTATLLRGSPVYDPSGYFDR